MPKAQTYICIRCGRAYKGVKMVGDDRIRAKREGKFLMQADIGGYRCKEKCEGS